MIKLKNFVDVNLTSVTPSSDEENKTVVYIFGMKGVAPIPEADQYFNSSNYNTPAKRALLDAKAISFVNQFFALGGASLRVIRIQTVEATSYDVVNNNNELFLTAVKGLPMNQVALVLRQAQEGNISTTESTEYDSSGYHYENITTSGGENINCFNVLLANIQAVVTEQGTAYRKLLVRAFYPTQNGYTEASIIGDDQGNTGLVRNNNLIWKLCADEKDTASVLAYFSKVTLNNPDTLKDYCFTEEPTCTNMRGAFAEVDWDKVKGIINTDVDLQQNGTIINLGGNTSTGYDLIQEFESIYISQQIVNKEMELLINKVNASNAKSVIHSALIDVLETYYGIGYLIQAQYNGANLYRNIGGRNTCILANGEVITGGYKIIILPKRPGTDVHTFPEIEIIINTNKGIRFIKTTGVVL